MSPSREPPALAEETFLRDELAERIAAQAGNIPEVAELLRSLGAPAGGAPPARLGLRGLTGSARGYLASWLQRATGRTLLYVVGHG